MSSAVQQGNSDSMQPLSDPDSLIIPLTTPTLSDPILTLLDCGSSDCFIDESFVNRHNLKYTSIPPLVLRLLDGSGCNLISCLVEMPVTFPTGEFFCLRFFVTPLDSTCSLVLGYCWLRQYNPLVDWVTGHISFRHKQVEVPPTPGSPRLSAAPIIAQESPPKPPTPVLKPPMAPTPIPTPTDPPTSVSDPKPNISIINATAFARACKLPGSQSFMLSLSSLTACTAKPSKNPDLSSIPEEDQDYTDMFSKVKAQELALYWPYDLKIELEDGAQPP